MDFKRVFSWSIVLSVVLIITSCSSGFDQDRLKMNQGIYENAMEIEDWDVARMAMFNMLAIDSNNHDYYDTLAKIYFRSKDYRPALKSCKKALEFNENVSTTILAFECSRILKDYKLMIDYGKYLEVTDTIDISMKYEISFAYINQKKLVEATKYLEMILVDSLSENLFYKEYTGNSVQEVPYKASAYNLLGFIKTESSDNKGAKQMFQMAIDVYPKYKLAQQNLFMIDQMILEENEVKVVE
ncbi:MAG: hypothetical protein JKY30_05990 [Flavobacteriales bacterium]|nr:hypothetical protein [Flavobacteriales bacterium]